MRLIQNTNLVPSEQISKTRIKLSIQVSISVSPPCNLPWLQDGYCDDENNNIDCDYDGGDCCGPNTNTQYCSVCQCLENVTITTSTNIPTANSSITTLTTAITTLGNI